MASSAIEAQTYIKTGSDCITTSHTILQVASATTGKVSIINIALILTSDVAGWAEIGRLKNFSIPTGQYIAGEANGEIKLFYISTSGIFECTTSCASGSEIKVCFPLVLA